MLAHNLARHSMQVSVYAWLGNKMAPPKPRGAAMSPEINLSRWKLYAKVWETPMIRLAADLGVSDVGLRKACIRHDIPVPPRGHWARLNAGLKLVAPPLPRPEEDEIVSILPSPKLPRVAAPPMPELAETSGPIVVPASLDGCLPIVRKTARFFEALRAEEEREQRRRLAPSTRPNWSVEPQLILRGAHAGALINGRTSSLGDGRLHVVATLRHVDWILRFHEALVRSLKAAKIRVVPREVDERGKVQVTGYGAALEMSFMEEYERNTKAPRAGEDFNPWLPKDSFKLQFQSPLTQSTKVIRGTMAQVEDALPGIAVRVAKWLAEEAERERQKIRAAEERQAAAAARKIEMDTWFAQREQEHKRQALERERQACRTAQAGRLMQAARAQSEYALAVEWLDWLQVQAGTDADVQAWISVARAELREPLAELLCAVRQEAGQADRPLWWPDVQLAVHVGSTATGAHPAAD